MAIIAVKIYTNFDCLRPNMLMEKKNFSGFKFFYKSLLGDLNTIVGHY